MMEMREAMAEIQMANNVMSDEYATLADAKFEATAKLRLKLTFHH